ncbi:MAG TPA: type II toxin-antitoxin system RelE/ParE family toxin, partial [Hanamia sp.]
MVVVWNLNAKQELKRVYEYILKDSYQNAIKVRQEIIDAVLSLPEYPDKHQPDKHKINNDGTWRA